MNAFSLMYIACSTSGHLYYQKTVANFFTIIINARQFSVSLNFPFTLNQCAGMSDATLITALISVTCVLVVISVLMFIVGLICGHYLSLRRNFANKNAESSTSPTNEQVEDLEQKENVAYVTLRPK